MPPSCKWAMWVGKTVRPSKIWVASYLSVQSSDRKDEGPTDDGSSPSLGFFDQEAE